MASVSGSVESESMVSIHESKIRGHVDEVARTSVEETPQRFVDRDAGHSNRRIVVSKITLQRVDDSERIA